MNASPKRRAQTDMEAASEFNAALSDMRGTTPHPDRFSSAAKRTDKNSGGHAVTTGNGQK